MCSAWRATLAAPFQAAAGTPEDIGQMVAYLASPAGDWITGQIFVVDGGAWLAGGRE